MLYANTDAVIVMYEPSRMVSFDAAFIRPDLTTILSIDSST
jgi:hypothetical protein